MQAGPMDTKMPPTAQQEARYNRALTIAQQPLTVLQHIKDGTLLDSDIVDLHKLYPSVYQKITQKISNQISTQDGGEEPIPYKTRLGISMFLGQPLDSTMSPSSIIAAQPLPKPAPQQGPVKGSGKSMKSLGKSDKSYMTSTQSAESDRTERD